MPKPRYTPTKEDRAEVLACALAGYTVESTRSLVTGPDGKLGVAQRTFYKHYRREWELGRLKANAKLAAKAYQLVMQGDVTMLIFLCKCRLGWSTTEHLELGRPGDFDHDKRSDEEILRAVTQRAAELRDKAQRLGISLEGNGEDKGNGEFPSVH
jgi:hypothetical protein